VVLEQASPKESVVLAVWEQMLEQELEQGWALELVLALEWAL
jgi:hypothetical protein